MTDKVAFKIFPSDQQWKIDRNNEFVGVFSSQEAALTAAEGYREEIAKNGGETVIVVVDLDGGEQLIQP